MDKTILISLHYAELKELMVSLYKSAVNSYEDLAEAFVEQKLQDIISERYMQNTNAVKFELVSSKSYNLPASLGNISIEPTRQATGNNSRIPFSSNLSISSSFFEHTPYTYVGDTIISSGTNNLSLDFMNITEG